MSWRHRIATWLLVVLAGTPAVGAVCALACASPNAVEHHHGASGHDPMTTSAAELELTATAPRACAHDENATPATPAARADQKLLAAPLADVQTELTFATLALPHAPLNLVALPGNDPPLAAPLILRI